jgi:hypothetical protein
MLYYQFAVTPEHSHPDYLRLGLRLASIMIRLDDKITVCTSRAIQSLAAGHWQIVEIRHARMAETEGEFASDPQLVDLYREAEQQGMAYKIAVPPAVRGSGVREATPSAA